MEQYAHLKSMYEKIGYKVLLVSAEKEQGIEELIAILKDKTSLLSGHSGVGKSSLLNLISPGIQLKTGEISGWSGKGQHTTTFAEMFDLKIGGRVIDTPGMREFGLVDIEKQEVSHYFPEMRDRIKHCQFNNCLHVNEPGCGIKEAVRNGEIEEDRYVSYVNILNSLGDILHY